MSPQREAMRKHICSLRDEALIGADAKRRAVLRELARFALLFETSSHTNANAVKALGKASYTK